MGLRSTYRRCRFWQKKIIFSDETHFDLGWYVNKQNCRIWGTENPHAYIEKPTHPKLVNVWCGFWSRVIIWPFVFENEPGEAVTVNADRIWNTETPHAYIEKSTHPKRVTVMPRGIIGPFFFENEQREGVTVNSDRYRDMLNEFLFAKIEEQGIGNIWFQQNDATCHTAEATFDVLRPVFQDRTISPQS